jgi:hypothetical protein
MATTITAGNATSGLALTPDNTGILELKTGTGAGTTGISIDASQVVTGTAGNLMLVSGTAVASTSGTAIEFTSIPPWAKRITVMFHNVSTNSTGTFQIQLGTASAFEIASYQGAAGVMVNTAATSAGNVSTGFGIYNGGSLYNVFGNAFITLVDTNLWCFSFSGANGNTANVIVSGGSKSLASALTRLRIIASATGSPSDTFNGGSINIMWE